MMIYLRIQTNRAKIKEIIGQFSKGAIDGEVFIAPRPLPKENFKFYIGFGVVCSGSKNHELLCRVKNHLILSEEEYLALVKDIEFSWKSPKGRAAAKTECNT